MDTDELTQMAYECFRIAESTWHYLTIEFGAMSNNFNNEDDYLKGILKRVKNIKRVRRNLLNTGALKKSFLQNHWRYVS